MSFFQIAPRARTDHHVYDPTLFETSAAAPRKPETAAHVLACLDEGAQALAVLEHSLAIAEALQMSVSAARVLEAPHPAEGPADPLAWKIRSTESLGRLDRQVAVAVADPSRIERFLLVGPPADELIAWAEEHGAALMTLATHEHSAQTTNLGTTALRILNCAKCSVLLVPNGWSRRPDYRRVLLPLDGSSRAESILPVAVRIARAFGTELVLAHAVPPSEAIVLGSSGQSSGALRARLADENERDARAYLSGVEAQLSKQHIPVRSIIAAGDPRTTLRQMALDHAADLVIIAAHGRNGVAGTPCGTVAEFLSAHAPAPILIIRPEFVSSLASRSDGVRTGPALSSLQDA